MDQKLTEGRFVRYVSKDGVTEHPAVIVRVFKGNDVCANLQVFLDGGNDERHGFSAEECARGTAWRTSVHLSPEPKPETMHWPQR